MRAVGEVMAVSDPVDVHAGEVGRAGEVGDRDGALAWWDCRVEPECTSDFGRREEALWLAAAVFVAEP